MESRFKYIKSSNIKAIAIITLVLIVLNYAVGKLVAGYPSGLILIAAILISGICLNLALLKASRLNEIAGSFTRKEIHRLYIEIASYSVIIIVMVFTELAVFFKSAT